MINNFSYGYKTETHAKYKKAAGGGNVMSPWNLFRLEKPFHIRFFDGNVDYGQVMPVNNNNIHR